MGRRGPPKKPTAEKIAAGNPGDKPLNMKEPDFDIDDTLECPEEIKGAGRETWNDLCPMLIEYGVIRRGDVKMFAGFCKVLDDLEVQEGLRTAAWTAYKAEHRKKGGGDYIYCLKMAFAAQNMIIKLRTQMRHYAQELGLSPASRANIKATRPKGRRGTAIETKAQTQGIPKGNVSRFFARKQA